jgi:hypothetical protein
MAAYSTCRTAVTPKALHMKCLAAAHSRVLQWHRAADCCFLAWQLPHLQRFQFLCQFLLHPAAQASAVAAAIGMPLQRPPAVEGCSRRLHQSKSSAWDIYNLNVRLTHTTMPAQGNEHARHCSTRCKRRCNCCQPGA